MKITNKHGLPDAFLNFARDDKYTKGKADISVTTLIDSPRVRLMKDKHHSDIVSDVVDKVWPLFGTAVHHILESSKTQENVTIEERLFGQANGWTLSGAVDHQEVLDDGTVRITDYKVTSVWSVIFTKDAWAWQQNCYAWLLENDPNCQNAGRKVSSIRICAIVRDWSRRKAQMEPDYPKAPVVLIELPLWTPEERADFVSHRSALHQEAEINLELTEMMPVCSKEDTWAKPEKWAVKKKTAKRALRVFGTEVEANDFSDNHADKTFVEYRAGEATRCEGNYCNVAEFCDQFKGAQL